MNAIEKYYNYDEKAEFFFKHFRLIDGRFLERKIQSNYVIDASILNTIIFIENNYKNLILGRKKTGFWSKITGFVNDIDKSKINHSLPKSEKHIKLKCNQYKNRGYIVFVNGLYGNNNSRKIDNSVENLLKSIREQVEEPITYPKISNILQKFLKNEVIITDKTNNLSFRTEDFEVEKLKNISLSSIKNYVNIKLDEPKYNQLNIWESEISNDFFYKLKQLDQQKRISLLTQFTEIISIVNE